MICLYYKGNYNHDKNNSTLLILFIIISIAFGNIAAGAQKNDKDGVNQPLNAEIDYGRRTALIIGNADYQIGPLKNPENDAIDIADALERLGYSVTLITNASYIEMGRSIEAFGRELKKGGSGLFFYAGHGMQIKGRNYLIPVNIRLENEEDIPYAAIDANLVLAKMENARNALNVIILDACRNNPFARAYRSLNRGLASMDAPIGSLIVYATAPGSVAADGSGRNGVFTASLLNHIFTKHIDIELMLRNVRRDVIGKTQGRQVPWTASSLQGSFSFIPKKDRALSVTPKQPPELIKPDQAPLPKNSLLSSTRLVFTANGRNEDEDPISRRVFAKKEALKNIREQIVQQLTRRPYSLEREEAIGLFKRGHIFELEYHDSGKTVHIGYEVFVPKILVIK